MVIPSVVTRKRARIEIIPLIDVMFFLLATFIMVSLSMIQNAAVPVNLPGAHSAQSQKDKPAAVLTVTKAGQVYWGKEPVPMSDLGPRLHGLLAADPDPKVFIHGDKEANFGLVVSLLDEVRKAGIKRTALRTSNKGK
ncbi:MAG TPA: biopolymer transporter ExbD [bacterium]|nr:biopolymer transporter ExbD [bacterium]